MSSLYLTIENRRLVVIYKTPSGDESKQTITSALEWKAFLSDRSRESGVSVRNLFINCSSTLDFPHEYTRSKKVIDLVRAIR